MCDARHAARCADNEVLGVEFKAPQPRLLRDDVVGVVGYFACGRAQLGCEVCRLGEAAVYPSPKRVSCYRRPECFSGSSDELCGR